MLNTGIYAKSNLRTTVEGVLYKLRIGCPWRDLPQVFGQWNSVFKRFNDWSKKGKIGEVFAEISKVSDREWTFVDGTIVKAHQHSSGAAAGAESGIGKSVARNTSKIHMAVDSFGLAKPNVNSPWYLALKRQILSRAQRRIPVPPV